MQKNETKKEKHKDNKVFFRNPIFCQKKGTKNEVKVENIFQKKKVEEGWKIFFWKKILKHSLFSVVCFEKSEKGLKKNTSSTK